MQNRDKVAYLGRVYWIVGWRMPSWQRGETCRYYDLARSPNTTRIAFGDVPEKHLRLMGKEAEPVPQVESAPHCAGNGWAMPILVKG